MAIHQAKTWTSTKASPDDTDDGRRSQCFQPTHFSKCPVQATWVYPQHRPSRDPHRTHASNWAGANIWPSPESKNHLGKHAVQGNQETLQIPKGYSHKTILRGKRRTVFRKKWNKNPKKRSGKWKNRRESTRETSFEQMGSNCSKSSESRREYQRGKQEVV